MNLKGKTAVITGASGGIGYALSIAMLATDDTTNVIAIGRNESTLKQIEAMAPERVTIHVCDLAIDRERQGLISALSDIQQIDFLVHCAAVIHPLKQLADISENEWRFAHQVNVETPLFLTTALLPKMQNGRVMFLTSDSELQPVVGAGTYCVHKNALHMLWQCLKAEYQGVESNIKNKHSSKNIAFGLIAPGNVDTAMQQAIRETTHETLPLAPLLEQAYKQGQLLKPNYVAQFLRWLLCDVDPEQYSQKIWNIYSELSHQKWIKS